ncbi:MAG: flagella basal body P-ring formation protein FlgA, partial [Bacteriovoracia bacterium]
IILLKNGIILIFMLLMALTAQSKASCQLELPPQVILFNDNVSDDISFIKQKNCPDNLVLTIAQTISGIKGVVPSTQLLASLEIDDPKMEIKITPNMVKVVHFEKLLRQHLELPQDFHATNAKALNGKKYLMLNLNDSLEINCKTCNKLGTHNVQIKKSNPLNPLGTKNIWVSTKLLQVIEVLQTTKNIPAFQKNLSQQHFKKVPLMVEHPERYFIDSEKLNYYKNNRQLAKGKALQLNDVSPVPLVKAGVTTKIILKSNTLSLEGKGVARQSGYIDQDIELFHPKTRKPIFGKVIGTNKVIVEL